MQLEGAFIQSDIQCIHGLHLQYQYFLVVSLFSELFQCCVQHNNNKNYFISVLSAQLYKPIKRRGGNK